MPTIEIYRAKIDPANVERLLEIRADAVAEFQAQLPELVRAELVALGDDVWLDILLWSEPVDDERIARASEAAPTAVEMHGLITEVLSHERGEVAHTTQAAWATAR